jgi:hypothetical protein
LLVLHRSLERLFFLNLLQTASGAATRAAPEGSPPGLPEDDRAMLSQWVVCDPDEQRVLAQLVRRGYATPHPGNEPALERLVERGLLSADTLTPISKPLGKFVRRRMSGAALRALESRENASPWHAVRVPLATAVTILLVSLGVSQPELAAAGLSVPGALALFPAIIQRLASR